MNEQKIEEGRAYWCAINYQAKKRKGKSNLHLGIIVRIFEGVEYNNYLVAGITTSYDNLDLKDIEYTKIYYKNKESIVKHHELHCLSDNRIKRFAFKLGDDQFKNLKKKIVKWIQEDAKK